jgi:hypothetical protein
VIVIGTSQGREAWATQALASLPTDMPRMVLSCAGFEIGKLRWVMHHTELRRFWFLQDSVVVKDSWWLRDGLQRSGPVSLCMDPCVFGMFMGVYERKVLKHVELPHVTDKEHAIRLETEWTRDYLMHSGPAHVMFPEFADRNAHRIEHLHGRDNLVLENEFLVKYKGTWR